MVADPYGRRALTASAQLAASVALCIAAVACTRPPAAAPVAGTGTPVASTPAAPLAEAAPQSGELPARALDAAALAALHPEATGQGATCAADVGCAAPLRCSGGTCQWPAAMTGVADATTAVVTFAAANGSVTYNAEVAASNPERMRGLMFRRNMAPDFGMVFVFETDRPQAFWMRNTLIPLDMVFVRSDGVVDSVVTAEPLTETPRPSAGPAMYVVELNAGEAGRNGIGPGVRVEFSNLPGAR